MTGTKNEEEECTQYSMTYYLYLSQDTCVTENGYVCVPFGKPYISLGSAAMSDPQTHLGSSCH